MVSPKPFVQIACICEKVLVEPDSVASLIRVVDTYFLDVPKELPANLKAMLGLSVFISLKSGDVTGEHEIGLRLITPDGSQHGIRKWPADFRGAESGVNLKIAFSLGTPQYGLYWFDVLWGEEVLTRIPFRLKPKTTESPEEIAEPSETTTH
jgi:hypothetical protein